MRVDDFEARRWKERVRHGLLGATPTRIGPYELHGQIGRGGMGLVYRGHDPRLDRPVAIKVLRRREGEEAVRLRDEARTLAELDHPNIVRVFDVGVFEERVFVVMPLIEGETLDVWTRGSVTDTARVEVLVQAGRGVAAAHAAGILHRDIKPANIMVEPGGCPVVLDFGLGKSLSADTLSSEGTGTTSRSASGTPGYVAPEQAAGGLVDARADVYAFCVTVLECLSQRAPVPAHGPVCSAEELDGLIAAVPRRWRSTLRAGVDHDPGRRPRSMAAVLQALERARTQRRWWAVAGVLAVAAGLAWPSGTERTTQSVSVTPPRAPDASVARTLAAAEASAGAGDLGRAADLAHQGVVAAQRIDDDVGLAEALALRGRLAVRLGHDVAALSDLEDAHAMARAQDRVDLAFESALTMVDVLADQRLGTRAQEWLRHAESLLDRVPTTGARARWLLAASRVARVRGSLEDAARLVGEAAGEDASPAVRVAIRAHQGKVEMLRGNSRAAVLNLSAALADARATWAPRDPRIGRVLADLGAAHLSHGDVEPAEEVLDEAVEHLASSLGTTHPQYVMAVQNRAIVQWRRGDLEGAIASYRQGVRSLEASRGPEHPEVAHALENLSTALIYAGEYDDALRQQNRALVIRESALGAAHPSVARTLGYIAQSHEALGQWEQASSFAERAHRLALQTVGRENSATAEAVAARSRIEMALGRPAEAHRFAEEALAIYASIGAGPLELGSAHATLAYALCGVPSTLCRPGTAARSRADAAIARALELYAQAGEMATPSADALTAWTADLP